MTMPDLNYGNIHLPGGWQIGVPEIKIDADTRTVVVESGIDLARFNTSMQLVFETGMLRSVRQFMRYWSGKYRKSFPDLFDTKSGELAGFDPNDLMRYWLPSEKAQGFKNVELTRQLGWYAREARREIEK